MKIRWTRNSLRLRIMPSELEALQRSQTVVESLKLPNGAQWQVTLKPGTVETHLTSEGTTVVLALAPTDLERLAAPDAEGVYFQTEDGTDLRYFVEKDFPCVHPRAMEALEPLTETFSAPADFEDRKGMTP